MQNKTDEKYLKICHSKPLKKYLHWDFNFYRLMLTSSQIDHGSYYSIFTYLSYMRF